MDQESKKLAPAPRSENVLDILDEIDSVASHVGRAAVSTDLQSIEWLASALAGLLKIRKAALLRVESAKAHEEIEQVREWRDKAIKYSWVEKCFSQKGFFLSICTDARISTFISDLFDKASKWDRAVPEPFWGTSTTPITGEDLYAAVRWINFNWVWREINGYKIDATTAMQIQHKADSLKPKARARFLSTPIKEICSQLTACSSKVADAMTPCKALKVPSKSTSKKKEA